MTTEKKHEPSVNSPNKQDRIAARRINLAKQMKIKAQKKELMHLDALSGLKEEIKLSLSEQQLQDSRNRLRKLYRDGTDFVTNIKVTTDLQESVRRYEEEEAGKIRRQKLEDEVQIVNEKFNEIVSKWHEAKSEKVPQKLFKMVKEQKEACDAIIQERTRVISELQEELRRKEAEYVQNLKKREENVSLITERINYLILNLNKASKEELKNIEMAFDKERSDFLHSTLQTWESSLHEMEKNEIEYLKKLEKEREEHEVKIHESEVMDVEDYITLRRKLEDDVHQLELHLQKMKALYLLNQEKLEYNFQVLRKRDEDNLQTKSDLKRRLTFVHDKVASLRSHFDRIEREGRDENLRLTAEYKRVANQIPELSKKGSHFHQANVERFNSVWMAKVGDAKDLVKKVLNTDEIIHDDLLNQPWEPPNLGFLQNEGTSTEYAGKDSTADVSRRTSSPPLVEELSPTSATSGGTSLSMDNDRESLSEMRIMRHTELKKLLDFICDEMGFLVESKLLQLLAPVNQNEQTLMTLNAVFRVLGIESGDDIADLTACMLKYSQQGSLRNEVLLSTKDVLEAFKEYLEAHRQFVDHSSAAFHDALTLKDDPRQEVSFWKPYAEILPKSRERLWDALLYGLEKYHHVLKKRSKCLEKKFSVSRQNGEIGVLLHNYMQHGQKKK